MQISGENNESGARQRILQRILADNQELRRIIEAWPTLSADTRRAVVAIVDGSK
jgi:hypothetical protein